MRAKWWIVCVLALAAPVLMRAQEEEAGAKELFGGGVTRTVVGFDEKPPATSKVTPKRKPKPVAPVFGLSCWIELSDGPGRPGAQVVHTRTFRSGEKIRLHFQGNSDGYISLVQFGASGTSSVLFPDPAKGLGDNAIRAGADHVLPSEKHWFRFDATPGTERLMVLFAKTQKELDAFIRAQALDPAATAAMLQAADRLTGSKDLVTEIVDDEATYVVNRVGELVVMKLALVHE